MGGPSSVAKRIVGLGGFTSDDVVVAIFGMVRVV